MNEQPAVDVSTYVVLILYPKTNSFRLTFTRVIEIEIPTHPPLAALKNNEKGEKNEKT